MSSTLEPIATRQCRYHFDWLMAGMLCGAFSDCATTWWILAHRLGVEANPVAAPLFRHSLWWILPYILLRPLLVPFLPAIPRAWFGWFYLLVGFTAGANNLSGILFHDFFLVNRFGIWTLAAFWACIACVMLTLAWRYCRGRAERLAQIKTGLVFVGLFLLLEAAFWGMGLFFLH